MTHDLDPVEFDDIVSLALAESAAAFCAAPHPDVKQRILRRIEDAPTIPDGFSIRRLADDTWEPHPVPGIRMKVLSMNRANGYATLLLDVDPGTHFPPHFHSQAEECFVVSGSLYTCGQHLRAGDFIHADAQTAHGELWTEEGCRVILVVEPEDYMQDPISAAPRRPVR